MVEVDLHQNLAKGAPNLRGEGLSMLGLLVDDWPTCEYGLFDEARNEAGQAGKA